MITNDVVVEVFEETQVLEASVMRTKSRLYKHFKLEGTNQALVQDWDQEGFPQSEFNMDYAIAMMKKVSELGLNDQLTPN